MGRLANDGRGRLGGRAKGTGNKPLAPLNEWVNRLLNANRKRIEQEFNQPWTDKAVILYAALTVAAAINDATAALTTEEQEPNLNA